MNPTRNDLGSETRKKMVAALNDVLASLLDAALQAKQAHWNVKGPQFIALHELFDEVASHLHDHADTAAERAVALGGLASGTLQNVASGTQLPVYPPDAVDGMRHVELLSASLGGLGKQLRGAIAVAEAAGDAGTADLFTELSRGVDKDLWFLEAHLQH